MARLASFIVVLVMLTQCSVRYSNAVKGEQRKMDVVVDENKDVLASANITNQSSGRGSAVVGTGISLAVSGIKSLINADKKKYVAEYEGVLNELYFYNNISVLPEGVLDPTGVQFKGFHFERMVKPDGKRIKKDTAMYALFEMDTDSASMYEMVNNSIFRLRMKDLRMNYSKAKVPSKKWYVPWTWFTRNAETVNLDFDIAIRATWFSKDGTFYDNVQIGKFNMTVRDLPLDSVKQRAFLASDPRSPINKRASGYSVLVPRSVSAVVIGRGKYDTAYGKGIYRIDCKVKEASKQSFALKSFYDNSDALVDSASKLIK